MDMSELTIREASKHMRRIRIKLMLNCAVLNPPEVFKCQTAEEASPIGEPRVEELQQMARTNKYSRGITRTKERGHGLTNPPLFALVLFASHLVSLLIIRQCIAGGKGNKGEIEHRRACRLLAT